MIIMPGVTVIVTVIMVITRVKTIAAAIMIAMAFVFVMSRAGSPFGFFGISIPIHRLYQLADGGRPLMV